MIAPPSLEVLIPSMKRDAEIVCCNFDDFRKLIYLALSFFAVDETWYCQNYPDVERAIAEGYVASATDHFRQAGYWEGRIPVRPDVDEQWYLERYPDVSEAIAAGNVESATAHYLSSGHREGRMPRPVPVDQNWYLGSYPRAALRVRRGDSIDALTDYERYGYREGFAPYRPNRSN